MSFLHRLRTPPVSTALKAVLALIVVSSLVYFVELEAILAAAARARWEWITAAAALMPLNVLLEGQTWRFVLRTVQPRLPMRTLYGALLAGFALGLFTPARAGDFVGRAFYLRHADRWTTTLTVVVQRLMDMTAAIGMGLLAALLALRLGALPSPWWPLPVVAATLTVLLGGMLLAPHVVVRWAERLLSSEKVLRRLRFLRRLRPRRSVPALGCALLRYGVYLTQMVLLLRAFVPAGFDFSFARAYVGTGLMYLGKFTIPSITLMDLGLREGLAVFFLGRQLGFPEAAAFNASLLLFALNLVLPAAAGLPFVLRLRMDRPASEPSVPERRAA